MKRGDIAYWIYFSDVIVMEGFEIMKVEIESVSPLNRLEARVLDKIQFKSNLNVEKGQSYTMNTNQVYKTDYEPILRDIFRFAFEEANK